MDTNSNKSLTNEKDDNFDLIEIQCSAKKLKTLFYCDPSPPCDSDNEASQKSSFTDFMNWPGMSVKINFPHFELIRENRNYSKYKLFSDDTKFTNQTVQPQNTLLQQKRSSLKRVTFVSSFICEYLKQIQKLVDQLELSNFKKHYLINIINEFVKDISLCDPTIDIGVEYFKNLTKYPYVRYLGQPFDYTSKTKNSKEMKAHPKVRLQEITYPVLYFSLTKFGVFYHTDELEKIKFVLDDCQSYFSKNKWISFECKQCDKVFEGVLAMYELDTHFTLHQGYETNWTCTMCGKVYTMRNLSKKRWTHCCEERNN